MKKICNNYKLPYFTITPRSASARTTATVRGSTATARNASAECEVYSRIVGYLRPVRQWNKGKKAEFKERKTYAVGWVSLC